MKNVIKKLGISLVLLVTVLIAGGMGNVQAVGDSDSKATIEFTEAWDPELPFTSGPPNPDKKNPPKKFPILPQTGETANWQYSALGILLIGTGAVLIVQRKRKEDV